MHRSPAFAFFCAYALFVAYATLLPFQFITDPAALRARHDWINWNPFMLVTGEPTPITDVVANVLFFVPFGFIGFHAQRPRRMRTAILRSTLAGFALSVTVEVLQCFAPTRDPSTSDVITNTLGTAIGALLAAFFCIELEGRLLRRVAAWTAREPLLPVLVGYAMLVGISGLVPFDFGLTVSALKHALRAAQLDPHGTPRQWADATQTALQSAILAALALHVAGRLYPGRRTQRFLLCWLGVAAFAVGLEVAQLTVRSRVLATRDMLTAIAGSGCGAALALLLGSGDRARHGWKIAAAACAGGLVVQALSPFAFHFDLESMRSRMTYTALIPYSSYYYKASVAAVADFLAGLLVWLPFAFVLARLRSRGGPPVLGTGVVVMGWCALFALALEGLQLGVPRRYPEISDVLTAALGAGLGAYAWRWCAHLGAEGIPARTTAIEPLPAALDAGTGRA